MKTSLIPLLLAAMLCPGAGQAAAGPWDQRVDAYVNKLASRWPQAKRSALKAELDRLDVWASAEGYFPPAVRIFLLDKWALVISRYFKDDGSLDPAKGGYSSALKVFHSLATTEREGYEQMSEADRARSERFKIKGAALSRWEIRTVEHFATAAHASYSTGNLPAHLASLLWNAYSVTRKHLESIFDPAKLAENRQWGEDMNHSLVTESAAAFWARELPGSARLRLTGVSETLFLDDFLKSLGKDPMGLLKDMIRYVGGQKL